MKKNKLENTLGIEIKEGVFYEQPFGEARSQQNIFDYTMKLLLVFFGCIGMMYCLEDSFRVLFDSTFVSAVLAFISLYFLVLFSGRRRGRRLMMAAGVLVLLFLAWLFRASWVSSVCYTYSLIAESYNSYYGLNLYLFEAGMPDANAGNLGMVLFMLPVCALLAYSAGHSSRIRYAVAAFLPYIVLIMASGHMPDARSMYLVIGSFLGLMIISKTAFCGEFQPGIHADYVLQKGLRGTAVLLMLLFFTIAAVFGYGLLYSKVENILGPIRYTVYNSSFRELYDQIRGGYSAGGINGGRLDGGGKLKFNHSVHLIISTDTRISQYTYLKGYVGEVYDGNGWDALPASAYSSESFSALGDYDAADIMSLSYELLINAKERFINGKSLFSNLAAARWFVRVPDAYVGDSSYLCYPYAGLVSDEDGEIIDLTYLTRRSGKELDNVYDVYYCSAGSNWMGSSLNSIQSDIKRLQAYFAADAEPGALDDLMRYVELEKKYRTFVYENDLDVPDRISKLSEQYSGLTFETLAEAVEFVQEEVARDATYTLTPGRCPYGKDFIEYFMYEKKEGYCVYFASAAVMIFRCLGIPARFVQGYIIPPVDANTELSIDDSYAHAWPEIYVDGFGWLPVEVTPGFGGAAGGFTPDMNQVQESYGEGDTSEEPVTKPAASQTEEEVSLAEPASKETDERTTAERTTGDDAEKTTGEETRSMDETGQGSHGAGRQTENAGTDASEPSGTVISSAAIHAIRNILLVILAILLAFGFLYSHRRAKLAARHRKFSQKSGRNCFLAIYRELCYMSTHYYIPVDDTADPHDLSLHYPIEEEIWERIQCIAKEAAFSEHEITDEKKQLMLSVYHKCCRHIDTKLRFAKKLVFHLWDGYR